MLTHSPATTVLVASDIERARAFYTDKLGLIPVDGPRGIAMFTAGKGTHIVIYQKEGGSKAVHTVVGFEVHGIDALLAELKAKGVEQDMENLPEGAGEDGVVRWGPVASAWIKDSEGNIIALNEMLAS